MGTHHICSGDESTFNLALSLHTTAPRIEAAFAQYAKLDEAALGVADCAAWVDFQGKAYCDAEQLQRAIERGIDGNATDVPVRTLPFDHVSGADPKAVLYYSPSTDALPLLTYLDKHAKAIPEFAYVVRYRPTGERTRKTPLSGYGVEMALKKTDYLVVDDRVNAKGGKQVVFENKHKEVFPELGEDPWTENSKPLTEDEVKRELGITYGTNDRRRCQRDHRHQERGQPPQGFHAPVSEPAQVHRRARAQGHCAREDQEACAHHRPRISRQPPLPPERQGHQGG